MIHPEPMRLPDLAAHRQTASMLGVDEIYAQLNALVASAARFGSEAEDGVWQHITTIYGQGARRVSLGLSHALNGGYMLTIDETDESAEKRLKAVAAVWVGLSGGAWEMLADNFDAVSVATLGDYLRSLGQDLALLAREVEERLPTELA